MTDLLWSLGPVGVFLLMICTALFPWMNAEVVVLALPGFAKSRSGLAALFAMAVVGHMTGKAILYWTSRKGESAYERKLPAVVRGYLDKVRTRMATHPASAIGIVLLSSIVGLPPFYLATLAAGAIRMNFALYITAGTAGRIVRLGTVLLVGERFLHWIRDLWHNIA